MNKYKAMIVTVGTGEGIENSIFYSIKIANPDYIVFLLTKESKNKKLPIILEKDFVKSKKYEKSILKEPEDVEEISHTCENIIEKLRRKGYKEIVIDYTSGTKAMSAGVVLAGINKKIDQLIYISGRKREEKTGRVISTTEKPVIITPNKTYAESLFLKALELFNKYQYENSFEILEESKNLYQVDEFKIKVEMVQNLCKVYSYWDKFDLKNTFEVFKKVQDKLNENIPIQKSILKKEIENGFCIERVADLLLNAERRAEEKKFDDATARLYRLIEYIAQIEISKEGLYKNDNTSDIDIMKLPDKLKDKYSENEKEGSIKLALIADYELLCDLNNNLGKIYKKYEDELTKLLSFRNNSILAHGFQPMNNKNYEKFKKIVEKIIKKWKPEVMDLKKQIRFIKLKNNFWRIFRLSEIA